MKCYCSDGTRSFEWDPLNRLTAVTSGTHRSEFSYNGLSQRVKIIEKDNNAVTSTKQFVWIPGDPQPSEERDGSNNITKRFYAQGEQIGGASYYYTKDHLRSICELADSSGGALTRYDYDPYGRRTKLTSTVDADLGFAGHYYHQPSGLHLAFHRAYDADLARWISRDPIGESPGINLYRYVQNNPINRLDLFGLADLVTDMYNHTTTFDPRPEDPGGQPFIIPTRNDVAKESLRGADAPCGFELLFQSLVQLSAY
jgi:RHS repeat-associated protein